MLRSSQMFNDVFECQISGMGFVILVDYVDLEGLVGHMSLQGLVGLVGLVG